MNVFVTPPGSQAVNTHFDYDDVFVFQMSGEKSWKVWDPPIVSPLPHQAWTKFPDQQRAEILDSLDEPRELTLRPGDVLYLPRGFLHGAEAVDHTSVHLTAAMAPITKADMLHQLVEVLSTEDTWLREAVQTGAFTGNDARAFFADLAQRASLDASALTARWKLRQHAWEDLPPEPLPVLSQTLQATDGRAKDGTYQLREGLVFDLVTKGNDVCLRTSEAEINIPDVFSAMLARALSGELFTMTDLISIDPQTETGNAEALVQALMECGVLVPAQ
jgi:hypothetical protein